MRNKTKTPPFEKGGSKKKKMLLWCAIIIVVFYAIIAIAPSEPQKQLTYTEEIAENWEVPEKEVKSIVSVAKELGIKKSKLNITHLDEDSCTIKYIDTDITFNIKDDTVSTVKKDETVFYENGSVTRMPKTVIMTQAEKKALYDWVKMAIALHSDFNISELDKISNFDWIKQDNSYAVKGYAYVDDKKLGFVITCDWTGNTDEAPTFKEIQWFPN